MRYVNPFLVILILVSGLALPSIALAAAEPDSDPTIPSSTTYVNRNLIETGDMLIYALYNIPYATTPDERVDQLFLFSVIDTDGITVLASNEAYSYANNGIGQGVISFYFDAAGAPTWGLGYRIRITQKIDIFPTPKQWNSTVTSGAYTSASTQAANRSEVYNNIIGLSQTLAAAWGSSYDLLDQVDTGQVLSDQGETYFREAIYGLQVMCPQLFLTVITDPDYSGLSTSTYTDNTTEADALAAQNTGTPQSGVSQLWATMWGVDFNMFASLPLLIMALAFVIASAIFTSQAWGGFVCAEAIGVVAFAGGWLPVGIMGIIITLSALLLLGLGIRKLMPA